jgi:hypothetical protein
MRSLENLHGSILSLHAFIVRVYGPTRLHFEPLQLLSFIIKAALDPAFHLNADSDPDPASKNNADLFIVQ